MPYCEAYATSVETIATKMRFVLEFSNFKP